MSRREYQSPWELLGIEAGADLPAIRRAYSQKLKLFRPDEDPAGFQRLREARDQAVRHLEYRMRTDLMEDEEEEEPWHEPEQAPEQEPEQAAPAQSAEAVGASDILPEKQAAEPVAVEFVASATVSPATPGPETPAQPGETAPPAPPEGTTARNDLVADEQPMDKPVPPSQPDESPPSSSASEAPPPHPRRPTARTEPAPAAKRSPPDDAQERSRSAGSLALQAIAASFATGTDCWNGDAWRNIMQLISEASFYERPRIEWEIARRFGTHMQSERWAIAEPPSLVRRILQPWRAWREEDQARAERRARAAVLRLVDEEFGWCRDDKMLYATLGAELADRLADHVREARAADPGAARSSVFPPRRRADGFPVLEERDLTAFLHTKNSPYLTYYQTARKLGTFPAAWSYLGLMLPFYTALRARRWLLGSALFAASMAAGSAYISLAVAKHELLAVVPLLVQVFVHFAGALNAKRWCIEGAARAIEQADKQGLVFAAERARFLDRRGRPPGLAYLYALVLLGMVEGQFMAGMDEPRKPQPRTQHSRSAELPKYRVFEAPTSPGPAAKFSPRSQSGAGSAPVVRSSP